MRGALLVVWLMIPAVVAAYHYGPGQQQLVVDEAGSELRVARNLVEQEDYARAVKAYDAALVLLPEDKKDVIRRARVERAKAHLLASQLPEAYNDLVPLTDELAADESAPADLVSDARNTMANAHYYLTWLMRLEGEPRDVWEPEIEAARQHYRLLAEQATAAGDEDAAHQHSQDLEAAIRLARMDLSELQALPLPGQCKSCCSGKCNCRGKGKKPSNSQKKSQDVRGASSGAPPDERGS